MLDTATLSVAVPLIVNGFADALFSVAPFAGVVTDDEGALRSGGAVVVYESEEFAAIGLLFASLTAVVTVTEYNVEYPCPLVVNTA